MEPVVWVVAGCLFEVSLPGGEAAGWRWADPSPEVTMLAEEQRQGQHHFRFRAEAAGATAGSVQLRFTAADGTDAGTVVNVAPERLPDAGA